jgi:peptidyl-tRNA hydrolase, PTH1 family
MHIIIGLGNPGKEYEKTRHNLGFLTIEEIAKKIGVFELREKNKVNAFLAEAEYGGGKLILAQPNTFMNNSGQAANALLNWYKILPSSLIVVYDDVDLEPGQLRVREKGNAGGHHGMESIIQHIGTAEFPRIRIGIGRPEEGGDVSAHVLGKISNQESELLVPAIVSAAEAALLISTEGVETAMNRFNA